MSDGLDQRPSGGDAGAATVGAALGITCDVVLLHHDGGIGCQVVQRAAQPLRLLQWRPGRHRHGRTGTHLLSDVVGCRRAVRRPT